jgi:hypothetical protein
MHGKAVRIQLRMVVKDESLDHSPPRLHHITNQTGLSKLCTVQETEIGIQMRAQLKF